MERGEKAGLGVAAAGHVLLFAALSASFLAAPRPAPPTAMEVSLAEDVALEATAPAAEPPAPSVAPDSGPPEDSAPPAPVEAAPEPAPPVKTPPVAPPKPAPAAKPQPRAPAPQPEKAKPPAKPAAQKGAGTQVAANTPRPRGSILGSDFLKGLAPDRSNPAAKGQTPRAATMSPQAAADIGSAITRQVQPCAGRQQLNAPGAERITSVIRLNFNRDGSLNGRPTVVGHTGVDSDNARYVERVDDLTIAAVVACSPLRGLPPELYEVRRGWKTFRLEFNLFR